MLEVLDIAGLVRGASQGEGLGNKFLAQIREVEAILHVVRCFEDDQVSHVEGPVDAGRDTAVGRRPILQSREKLVEPGPDLLGCIAQHLEDPLLKVPVVDPDAAAAQLQAIAHQVIAVRDDLARVGLDVLLIACLRHSEGVVHGVPAPFFLARLEQGEVDDPQEVQAALRDRGSTQVVAHQAQDVAGLAPLVGHEEKQVADLGFHGRPERRLLLVGQELGDRRVEPAGLDLHPDQALGAPGLAPVGQVVQPVPRHVGTARNPDALHTRCLEGPEVGLREHMGQVDQFHSEPDVGLVRAEPLHCLVPRHLGELAGSLAGDRLRGRRDGVEDVVVLGASGRPAVAAAAVAATAVEWLLTGRNRVRGMVGLAEMVEPLAFLEELAARGLEAEVFEGDRALV